jgi:preprotein translocase subunit SecA
VLEYDDVMNKQREVIYGQRQRILGGEDLRDDVMQIIERVLRDQVGTFTGQSHYSEEWDLDELMVLLKNFFPTSVTVEGLGDPQDLDSASVADLVVEDAVAVHEERETRFGAPAMRELERWVLLRTIDAKWRDHLYEMDYLREGIGLRALAQLDPLVAYKNEGFKMFQEMMESIQEDFVRYLFHMEIVREEETEQTVPAQQLAYSGGGDSSLAQTFVGAGSASATRAGMVVDTSAEAYEAAQQATRSVVAPRSVTKIGRNDPCPCGSGKKYKKCCGA